MARHRCRWPVPLLPALIGGLLALAPLHGASGQEPVAPDTTAQDDSQAMAEWERWAYSTVLPELDEQRTVELPEVLARADPRERYGFLYVASLLPLGSPGNLADLLLDQDENGRAAMLGFFASLSPEQLERFRYSLGSRRVGAWSALPLAIATSGNQKAFNALIDPGAATDCSEIGSDPAECTPGLEKWISKWSYPVARVITRESPVPLSEAPWQTQLLRAGRSAASFYTPEQAKQDKKIYDKVLAAWEHGHVCGGAYLGGRWVLTAAHCIGSWDGRNADFFDGRRIRLGADNIDGGGFTLPIDAVVRHADYDEAIDSNDIALVRLAAEPTRERLRQFGARPIAMPASVIHSGEPLEVTGWGYTGVTDDTGKVRDLHGRFQHVSRLLMRAQLQLRGPSACTTNPHYSSMDPPFELKPGQVCAGSDEGNDSCKGDSGGPLVWKRGREPWLVGLVSFGPGCGQDGTPGVYTDVRFYAAQGWIQQAKKQARTGQIVDFAGSGRTRRCLHDKQRISCL